MAAEPPAPPGARRNAPKEKRSPSPGEIWLKQVYQDDRTSPMRYMVATAIRAHCYGEKIECFPAQATLAQLARTSTRTVKTEIAALVERGHLAITNSPTLKQPRRNRYRLSFESQQRDLPLASDTLAPGASKVKPASPFKSEACFPPKVKPASPSKVKPASPFYIDEFFNSNSSIEISPTVFPPSSARAEAADQPSEPHDGPTGQFDRLPDLPPPSAFNSARDVDGGSPFARSDLIAPISNPRQPRRFLDPLMNAQARLHAEALEEEAAAAREADAKFQPHRQDGNG